MKKKFSRGLRMSIAAKKPPSFKTQLVRARFYLDVEITKLARSFLADDTVNLLVVHEGHINVEAATQEFSDGNIFLPFSERGCRAVVHGFATLFSACAVKFSFRFPPRSAGCLSDSWAGIRPVLVCHWATPMGFSNRATHIQRSDGHAPCTAAGRWTVCRRRGATGRPPLTGKNSSCPRIPARRFSFSDQSRRSTAAGDDRTEVEIIILAADFHVILPPTNANPTPSSSRNF